MSAPQTQSETKSQASWKSLITYGLIAWAVSTTIWFACRAYTTVFEVLNLRVFIGGFILIAPYVAILSVPGRKGLPVKLFTSALLVTMVLAGEGLASLVTGKPILWDDKFLLGYFAVGLIFPFLKV